MSLSRHDRFWLAVFGLGCLIGGGCLTQARGADEPDKLPAPVFVASGAAAQRPVALERAKRRAIEQALGVLLTPDQLVAHHEQLNDNVLRQAAMFVSEAAPLDEAKPDQSPIEVGCRVTLQPKPLLSALRELKLTLPSRATIAARFRRHVFTAKRPVAAMEQLLDGAPAKLLKLNVAADKLAYNDAGEEATVPVTIRMNTDAYATFTKRLIASLRTHGFKPYRLVPSECSVSYGEIRWVKFLRGGLPQSFKPDQATGILVCRQMSQNMRISQWLFFPMPARVVEAINGITQPIAVAKLIGTDGKTVDTATRRLGEFSEDLEDRGILALPVANLADATKVRPSNILIVVPLCAKRMWLDMHDTEFEIEFENAAHARQWEPSFDIPEEVFDRVDKPVAEFRQGSRLTGFQVEE